MSTPLTTAAPQKNSLAIFSLVVEASFLYPLYTLLDTGLAELIHFPLEDSLLRLPLVFWLMPIILGFILNITLKRYSLRLLWILAVNVLIWGVSLFVSLRYVVPSMYRYSTILASTELFLSAAWGPTNLLRLWLIALFFVWHVWRTFILIRRPLSYKQAILHFEISLTTLFGVFMIASLTNVVIPGGMFWLLLSFASNATALSLASVTKNPLRDSLKSPWLGPLFLLFLLIPITLIFPLISANLSSPAAKAIAAPLPIFNWFKDIFLKGLSWFLKLGHDVRQEPQAQSANTPSVNLAETPIFSEGSWLSAIVQMLIRFSTSLIILLLASIIVYLVYRLLKSLWNKSTAGSPSSSSEWNFRAWWIQIRRRLLYWSNRGLQSLTFFVRGRPGEAGITQAYQALLDWGARHKHPRFSFETPFEYCTRLTKHFPKQANNILIITETYILHYYGARNISSPENRKVSLALRQLNSYMGTSLTHKQ